MGAGPDQQKNLNTVIIGKKGQDLKNEIFALQKKSDEFENKKKEKTKEFVRHFPKSVFEKFKSLTKDEKIDDKIRDKDKEIKFEREKEEIKKAIRSHVQSISGVRFSIRDTLVKTLDAKQEEIEAHIKSHFSTEENAQNFLNDGLSFLKKTPIEGFLRTCVFCGQELGEKAESLIGLYAAFFKGGYEQLQNEIGIAVDYFKGVNIEAILEKIAAELKTKDLDIELSEREIGKLIELKKQFEKELDKKRDLNYSINFDAFDHLKIGVEKVRKDLEELEQRKINVASPKSFLELEKEKGELEIIRERYKAVWVSFCADLENIETEAEKVRTEREEKRKELEAYSLVSLILIKKPLINFAKRCAQILRSKILSLSKN